MRSQALPAEILVYLLASRYCDTERLEDMAWQTFSAAPRPVGRECRRFAISFTTGSLRLPDGKPDPHCL